MYLEFLGLKRRAHYYENELEDALITHLQDFLMELEENDITAYDFSEYADELLILQGTKDEVVPPEMVSDFADGNGLLCLMIEGADHRFMDPLKMDEAIKEILEFFELS